MFGKKSPAQKVALVIMDGVGVAPPGPGNAVTLANTPNLDKYWQRFPHTYLKAAGEFVGLTSDADGNSEVGHLTMGVGKVVLQDLPRIDKLIETGSFFRNAVLEKAIKHAKDRGSNIHLCGLVGYGLVHSNIDHLYALLDFLVRENVDSDNVFLHAFMDGRDSSPTSGIKVLEEIEEYMHKRRIAKFASFVGRYYAKDRDKRYQRTKLAYELMTKGKGRKVEDFRKPLEDHYKQGGSDEYLRPHVIVNSSGPIARVSNNDVLICFDFRPDRAQQMTRAFEEENFTGFKRDRLENLFFVGFTDYKEGFPSNIAFPQERVMNTVGSVLSTNKKTQLRIAESEKFPHVTYFFDGGKEVLFEGEDQVNIPSNKQVATYDQAPEMKTIDIAKKFVELDRKKDYTFSLINFAAPDMVSHTGVLDASVKAMEEVDKALGVVVDYVLSRRGSVIITADHGNCEELINNRTGEIDTKHSSNDVPFIFVQEKAKARELEPGTLADIAPTIFNYLKIDKPLEMTGRVLV